MSRNSLPRNNAPESAVKGDSSSAIGDIEMYAGVFRRSVATLFDFGVVIALIVYVLQERIVPGGFWTNLIVAVAVPLLYEPALSAYVCTIGQALMATRIRRTDTLERMELGTSYKRFALKYVATIAGAAGAPAAHGAAGISVWPCGDHRAIHDLQAGTVVVNASAI